MATSDQYIAPSDLNIAVRGPFPSGDIDRLLSVLAPLDEVVVATRVVVDLRKLGRLSGAAVAVLVSRLRDVSARGVLAAGSMIIEPDEAEVAQRLRELGLVSCLVETADSEGFAHTPVEGSRPCQVFSEQDDPGRIARDLTEAIAEVCETDAVSRNTTWFALNELAQNVVDHAASLGGAVAVADTDRGGTELEIAIVDAGVGIRASLAKNPDYRDLGSDLAALQTAVLAGVTGRTDQPGGLGLFVIHVLLQANGGSLVLRSGTAQLAAGTEPRQDSGLVGMRGTLITVRFRTDRPFSLAPILHAADRKASNR